MLGDTICRNSTTSWFNLFRDVMSKDLIGNQLRLGGVGEIVEVSVELIKKLICSQLYILIILFFYKFATFFVCVAIWLQSN